MKSVLLVLAILIFSVQAEKWAVLVAGSNGFYNYRHQADVCHAYKTLIKNGYDPERVITMAYDDIANNRQNIFPGEIYNNPSLEGKPDNVYDGCVIDYSKKDVTPQNFLNVLLGKGDLVPQGHKVLNTTETDNIFIFFSDHGAPGLIAFPTSHLYEEDLTATFIQMAAEKRFAKLVFYLEACESGSMFLNLPTDLNIYALSAANPTESSWGTYCPPDDLVDGYSIGTCLGDEFSVNFMEDTDKGHSDTTLQEQFEIVRDLTLGSQVMQWGDVGFTSNQIGEFLWGESVELKDKKKCYKDFSTVSTVSKWDSRDNKLLFYQNRYAKTQDKEDLFELEKEIASREYFDGKFEMLSTMLKLKGDYHFSMNQKCLKSLMNIFQNQCSQFTDYGLKYVKYLAEMCDKSNAMEMQKNLIISKLCMQN